MFIVVLTVCKHLWGSTEAINDNCLLTYRSPSYSQCYIISLSLSVSVVEPPVIETCRLGIEGPNGEAANSTLVHNSTSCSNTQDTFVNFQPSELFLAFDFAFQLPVDPPSGSEKHNYVEAFHFGIVEAMVNNTFYDKDGSKR